ncbi:MAG TPA: hypothetical protein VN708_20835 [Terriglobales bacterium]|nr:hypothetical protein [Terriglobales bacterium]
MPIKVRCHEPKAIKILEEVNQREVVRIWCGVRRRKDFTHLIVNFDTTGHETA